ncbi:MAG TPA: GlsB/YeaQ/YmgE family stress response membrane protein [Gammaproteobacteria bacterium]|nr:GlsB/YeaQ/YmgE family stress response membrane protein [Gammaproteobacteria bacterium]
MVVGIIGAVIGGFVFSIAGIYAGGLIGSIITATVGAVLLLVAVRVIKKS